MGNDRRVIIIAGPNLGAIPRLYAPSVDAWVLSDNAGIQQVLPDWSDKP